jgi:hypothetical protein
VRSQNPLSSGRQSAIQRAIGHHLRAGH